MKLKDVHWPKMRNKLKEISSYELWRGRIKKVEAYYGTAVAGYFVSLRWLLWVNVALGAVWCGCVCIPQVVWEASSPASTSPDYELQLLLACNYSNGSVFYNCFHYKWYSYILDLLVGQGRYRYTMLYLGHYSTSSHLLSASYNIPAAILFFTLATYVVSFILIAFKLSHTYNGTFLDLGVDASSNFCNKLFSAWDHNVVDRSAIKLKKASIATDLKEELSELYKKAFKRTYLQLAGIVFIRTVTNLLVIAVLALSAGAVYYATEWSWKERIAVSSVPLSSLNGNVPTVLKAFLVPLVMNVLELVLPWFFELVVRLEKFKTKGGEVAMTIIRTAVVRIGNMAVYAVLVYIAVSCTQNTEVFYVPTYTSNTTYCTPCWETFLGQQFYTLALTNFLISIIGTIIIDTTRHIFHKLFHHRVKNKLLQALLSKRTFSISENILDLISSQFLLWMGFLFFPLHPLLMIFMLFVTFYVKWYSLMKNMEPRRKRVFRGALTQFLFVLLLLFVLLIAMIPVGFSAARLKPSEDCGPFKGKETMLAVLTDLINSIPNYRAQELIKFLTSSGFLIPLNMAYTATIFLLLVILRATHKKLQLVKAQLTTWVGNSNTKN